NNIYVDNVVSGTNTETEALSYYNEANQLMQSAGFKLRSWSSNCDSVRSLSDTDDSLNPDSNVNVLGIRWITDSDELTYPEKTISLQDNIITKRTVVRTAACLYDPIGYLSPVHIRAKLFIQELWKEKVNWDDTLSEDMNRKWSGIVSDLNAATNTKLKRLYFPKSDEQCTNNEYQLHVFADASDKAYGAAVYLRRNDQTALVIAKTRVAPLKPEVSLPRLELMASLIGARLMNFVLEAFKSRLSFAKCVLWSDSQIVIHWLNSNKRLPVFIANRVKEIKELLRCATIKYCPIRDNPADLLTRGISTHKLQTSDIWWNGPHWLQQGDWPVCDLFDNAMNHVSVTNNAHTGNENTETTPENAQTAPTIGIQHIVDAGRFGSLDKLLCVTALVLRFITRLKRQNPRNAGTPDADEIKEAEKLWIHDIQLEKYYTEIQSFQPCFNEKEENWALW
ncbi:uncharacterized protein LOC102803619, partial [Saccoglossus kowalevskii]|uniref:Uncharacterized protein LOC102803619 n=1 Tax=Saccoglossus kowalevskii TaxID=10224 RepID=A0ABM0MJ28_SACKO